MFMLIVVLITANLLFSRCICFLCVGFVEGCFAIRSNGFCWIQIFLRFFCWIRLNLLNSVEFAEFRFGETMLARVHSVGAMLARVHPYFHQYGRIFRACLLPGDCRENPKSKISLESKVYPLTRDQASGEGPWEMMEWLIYPIVLASLSLLSS